MWGDQCSGCPAGTPHTGPGLAHDAVGGEGANKAGTEADTKIYACKTVGTMTDSEQRVAPRS
eukprot:11460909-Karenia_brevis.AAC.1